MSDFVNQNALEIEFKRNQPWVILSKIEQQIKSKIEKYGTPLGQWPDIKINRGILTGCNEAFIIDEDKRKEILNNCKNEAERDRTDKLIRPILRGRDIKQGSYQWANLWVILAWFGSYKILKSQYPSIYNHLLQYEDKLKNRGQCKYTRNGNGNSTKPYPGQHHWLELDNNPSKEYLDDLNNQKILYSEIVQKPQFYLDDGKFIPEASAFYLTGDSLDFLANYLNTELSFWIFKTFYSGGGLGNKGIRYKKAFIINLPIPKKGSFDYLSSFYFTTEEREYITKKISEL